MRITDIAGERRGDSARIAASITWEDSDLPTHRMHFETVEPFAGDLTPDAHPFLVAAIAPAFGRGEARVAVEGTVCPRLRDGLTTAMQILGGWWHPTRQPLVIEPRAGFRPAMPPAVPRTGLLLSGGFDSLTSLRRNRAQYPGQHPGAVRDGFFVYGFDIGPREGEDQTAYYDFARATLAPVVAQTGVELIPVRTNLRGLDPRGTSWPDEWVGAAGAAIGHAFGRRLSRLLIAASADIASLEPAGSHPMLDPCFASAGLEIVHDGTLLSRLEKIRLVSGWERAFRVVRVCWEGLEPGGPLRAGGPLNCGRCRKCVRAMLGLLALGRLGAAASFPVHDVTPEMVETSQRLDSPRLVGYYRQLLGPLDAAGRGDLTRVIRRKVAQFEQRRAWDARKEAWRRFDQARLGGVLRRLSRLVQGR